MFPISEYLCLGRIIKLKYFGYGTVIKCKFGREIILSSKENSDIITEYNSNKENEQNILSYNEEDVYLKHIGFGEEMNNSFDNNDNITANDDNNFPFNKRLLRNKEYVNDIINNSHKNQKINSTSENNSKNFD